MDIESQRDLRLLEAVEQNAEITQRTLAARLGMALGLTNLYLKRLVRKGYIKCTTVAPHRLAYLITPRGMTRKARLTYEFMRYSLDLYRDARRHVVARLDGRLSGGHRVAIYGSGEALELACVVLRELGIPVLAVFADSGGNRVLGLPTLPIADHATVGYDVLIVAVLEKPKRTVKRLAALGVRREAMLLLREIPPPLPLAAKAPRVAAEKAKRT